MFTMRPGLLAALMASTFVFFASCVIDNTGSLEPADDDVGDDDASDDDDSATADDDASDENEVCPGSDLAFWTNWFRDVNGDGCLSRSERDDPDSDPYVAVATCLNGTFSTVWAEGAVSAGLPAYPFLDPTSPASLCEEEEGDDDDAGDDDTADDDDVVADDDDTSGDDDVADDDDATPNPPETGDEPCPGGWVLQWTRWWGDVDGDECVDAVESDSPTSDPWIDVGWCSPGSTVDYSYWEANTSLWVYDTPESPPFLPGTAAYACH